MVGRDIPVANQHALAQLSAATREILTRPDRSARPSPPVVPAAARGGSSGARDDRPGSDTRRAAQPNPFDSALRLLGVRARSRSEIRKRLLDKDFTPDEVESTLRRLEELDLIDDRDFAQQWVTSRHRHSGRGRQALRHELRTKGVDPAVAEEALSTIGDSEERERATELVVRKVGALAVEKLQDPGERDRHLRRLVAMLARRGFAHSLAFELASSAIAERRSGTG